VDIVGFTSLEGNIPSRVNNTLTIPANIATPMNMQRFFASIKDPASCVRAKRARERSERKKKGTPKEHQCHQGKATKARPPRLRQKRATGGARAKKCRLKVYLR
jgi:hypothetical protein